MRKQAFCICENKGADQLRSNHSADQHLRFHNIDSTIPLHVLPKSEISSLLPSSVAVQPGLRQSLSDNPKTGFLAMRLILYCLKSNFYYETSLRFKKTLSNTIEKGCKLTINRPFNKPIKQH